MADLICEDGKLATVVPAFAKKGFTIREMYYLLGRKELQVLYLADGRRMVAHEDFSNEAINEFATALYHEGRRTSERAIRGSVIVGTREEIK